MPVAGLPSDEGIRRQLTAERLASLPPAFEDAQLAQRFPEIGWDITAGNSSQISDGAAAVLVMSRSKATALSLKPLARIHSMSVIGDDPLYMLTAVVPATQRVLARAGLHIADIDLIEINEAFASVVFAWMREIKPDPERVNVNGGAIALGTRSAHPARASPPPSSTKWSHATPDTASRPSAKPEDSRTR